MGERGALCVFVRSQLGKRKRGREENK
ncbi:unnamed protein product [Tetraodon nigroviridis]|uniref:(spotted green pufferfish) hypothetical protein n=1 Tax=Tetraodon nigroviridis TaxID=99883 RepID=Q4S841_TETNG|nr:unnamed protein product [Tetraodon nigroviridis]